MNVKSKAITGITDKTKPHIEKSYNSEFRYLEDYNTLGEFFVWRNKVFIVSLEEDNIKGVIIEDKEVAKMYKIIFDKLWENSKK